MLNVTIHEAGCLLVIVEKESEVRRQPSFANFIASPHFFGAEQNLLR